MRLNHIGLIVKDIDEYKRLFSAIGLDNVTIPACDTTQKVKGIFVDLGFDNQAHIEILEPIDETSPVINFLRKRGGGLHHLCFEVEDIEQKSEELVKKGFKMVCPVVDCFAYDENFQRKCSQPTRIAFFMLSDRLLIELLEKGK
ncbi:MAG TPA: VOC family protein [Syntrophorhabdaceae bacterium]|nr:VOC family protein [Syntrophorhabdaceae bacterium]